MDQEQVDVVEAELLERAGERLAGVVGAVVAVVELAGDEHLAAVDAGGADRLADAPLVAVHLGGVDVAVADLEGRRHGLGGVLGRDLEDAEAELRDRVAVVERRGWECVSGIVLMCVSLFSAGGSKSNHSVALYPHNFK